MADYCAVADVQSEIQHLTFSGSTKPTSTEVTTWCGQVTADMNARMAAVGITTPVTDAEKLKVLKAIAVDWVMWKVLGALKVESEAARSRRTSYDNSMKNIEKSPAIIEEVGAATYAYATGSSRTSKPFTRSGRNW